jgi:hypothetical protein
MDNRQFEKLEQRIQQGQAVTVVEKFLYEQERRYRAQPLNPVQQDNLARQQNPLLQPQPWYMRSGKLAAVKIGNSTGKGE